MWNSIVSVLDHCLFIYLTITALNILFYRLYFMGVRFGCIKILILSTYSKMNFLGLFQIKRNPRQHICFMKKLAVIGLLMQKSKPV